MLKKEDCMKRTLMWLCTAIALGGISACAHQDGGTDSRHAASGDEAALSAYYWKLNKALDEKAAPEPQWQAPGEHPLTLAFKDQRLSVTGLCNAMGAGYRTAGSEMSISQVTSTMRMCGDPSLMQYEQAVGKRLPQVKAWNIAQAQAAPVLTLRFNDGGQWQLQGIPTPETRYGSDGEILFLEVAPDEVACSHPLMPEAKCLKVRTVKYDANGLLLGYGPWETFNDAIEGYRHEPGVRNVLRVKRYTRKDVPADASRYAYVLDMTVERPPAVCMVLRTAMTAAQSTFLPSPSFFSKSPYNATSLAATCSNCALDMGLIPKPIPWYLALASGVSR